MTLDTVRHMGEVRLMETNTTTEQTFDEAGCRSMVDAMVAANPDIVLMFDALRPVRTWRGWSICLD